MVVGKCKKWEIDLVASHAGAEDISNAIKDVQIIMWKDIAKKKSSDRFNDCIIETRWHDYLADLAEKIWCNDSLNSGERFALMDEMVDAVADLHKFFHHDPLKWIESV